MRRRSVWTGFAVAFAASLAACGPAQPPPVTAPEAGAAPVEQAPETEAPSAELAVPAALDGKVEIVDQASPEAEAAGLSDAVKAAGLGGLSEGLVVRLEQDMSVYRLWSGPDRLYGENTNRLGSWWAFDAPSGTEAQYRVDYGVCEGWNDLTWAVGCTLAAGAVVIIGPGQSVSAEACENPGESYTVSDHWQVYIAEPWTRTGDDGDLHCPDDADYAVNPDDLAARE
ncbi:hypothetical protein [Enhygromyxa salina]|nr:hypothetical protein [Enhygromyxa salina]